MTHQASTTRRDLLKLAGGAATFAALGAIGTGAARAAAPMLGVLRPQVHRFKLGLEQQIVLEAITPATVQL